MDLYTAARSWTTEQEAAFASIMAERKCSRIQAIHLYKRGASRGEKLAQFAPLPQPRMDGDLAFACFILGLPTPGYRFRIYQRSPELDAEANIDDDNEYVAALLNFSETGTDGFVNCEPTRLSEPRSLRRQGGRPALELSKRERRARLRRQWREAKVRKRLNNVAAGRMS